MRKLLTRLSIQILSIGLIISPLLHAELVNSYAPAVNEAAPAVVNIATTRTVQNSMAGRSPLFEDFLRQFPQLQLPEQQQRVENSLGSGVIVDADGYVITNNHVVEDADDIYVSLSDGREAKAEIIGRDAESDLAVLRIELNELSPIRFGNIDAVQVGDVVLAIGNPFGVGQTVTQGIVSALGRKELGVNTFENFIQTDAAINPGNSGGALINVDGELLGINTAIFSRSGGSNGIGFAIPVDFMRGIMEQIIEYGSVERGWLGVTLSSVSEQDEERVGISGVYRNSPAHRAGVEIGDIIIQIDSKPFYDIAQVVDYIAQQKPDTKVTLRLLRQDLLLDVTITLGKRPEVSRRTNR